MELFISIIIVASCWLPLLVTLVISCIHFARIRRNSFNVVYAVFTLKPVLVTPVWAVLVVRVIARDTPHEAVELCKSALPALAFTVVAAGSVAVLFRKDPGKFLLMLAMDLVRMALPTLAAVFRLAGVACFGIGYYAAALGVGIVVTAGVAAVTMALPGPRDSAAPPRPAV